MKKLVSIHTKIKQKEMFFLGRAARARKKEIKNSYYEKYLFYRGFRKRASHLLTKKKTKKSVSKLQ